MIFESHAHYDDSKFDDDREELLSTMQENGIEKIINIGCSIESCKSTLELTKQYPFVYGAMGIHPSDIGDLNEDTFLWLREQVKKEKVVAVGEIGLDYYWDKEEDVQKNQRIWFRRQLELAKESNLPVIIHSRDAAADTMEIMKEAYVQGIKGVIHCFSYSKEQAQEYVKMGYYIGVGGVATFKNAKKLKEVIETIPLGTVPGQEEFVTLSALCRREDCRVKRCDSEGSRRSYLSECRAVVFRKVKGEVWQH